MKFHLLQRLHRSKIVAIIRAKSPKGLLCAATALVEGGVDVMEVTLTTPNALELIREIRAHLGDRILLGAGSVLDPESCRAALLAGAEFIVTPTVNPEVIRMANRYGNPVYAGAYTPTEALLAVESGADFVKIFPADQLGPLYLKNLLAPMPQLPLVPTGGVTAENTAAFLAAGCVGVGVGSALVSKEIVETENWPELTRRAQAFVTAAAAV